MFDFSASVDTLLDALGYHSSAHYRPTDVLNEPEIAHMLRTATDAGAQGVYVIETSSDYNKASFPAQPIVYVAQAKSEKIASRIHRNLWNIGNAPFILVALADQVLVYSSFDYSDENQNVGLLERISLLDNQEETSRIARLTLLRDRLSEFASNSIDSGNIWQSHYAHSLNSNRRVDKRLLKNLKDLRDALTIAGSLRPEVAHALIGKYVYIRYLWDRKIIDKDWLLERNINPESVFGRNASIEGLSELVNALEQQFNGRIFPLRFDEQGAPEDNHVAWTASVFMGDKITTVASQSVSVFDQDALQVIQQLHLEFRAYDFQYIPIETLSSVYEQFIQERKLIGAIYTPEILADYLLSEINSIKPINSKTIILDPACGSGVFLVLAYRRLIEHEIAQRPNKKLSLEELKNLLSNIYGIERETDACYVTEFSLILTMLHYIPPHELKNSDNFKFPALHNKHIFEGDFFDDGNQFWRNTLEFDWIIGNPPWVKAEAGKKQDYAKRWINTNKKERPVGDLSVAEAFSWRVLDISSPDGLVGLLLPATSLFNINSTKYRRWFFKLNEILRITNFANLRDILFNGRADLPAATCIYRKFPGGRRKSDITHYGPFSVNQITEATDKQWVITINENEIQNISPYDAEKGETSTWKLALWGTYNDKRILERIQDLFPTNLHQLCIDRGWGEEIPSQGVELRRNDSPSDPADYDAALVHQATFDTKRFNKKPRRRFTLPARTLIPNGKFYIRRRGGRQGLAINPGPHIVISKGWDYVIFSDDDFIIPPQTMGIAAPRGNENILRALAVYLSSSLITYYLFFQVPEWGIFRQRESVVLREVRNIPTPNFTDSQVQALANLYRKISSEEEQELTEIEDRLNSARNTSVRRSFGSDYDDIVKSLHDKLQNELDNHIYNILNIPNEIIVAVNEFVQLKLPLDKGAKEIKRITRKPLDRELFAYAQELQIELDSFFNGKIHHNVNIRYSNDLIECEIQIGEKQEPLSMEKNINREQNLTITNLLSEIKESSLAQFSQWVYVYRALRLFEGSNIYVYKLPRLINWTRTQAIVDAREIIGQAINVGMAVQS